MTNNEFKVGNVAIVGRPNVGKSTLLNTLLNQKVAAVSDKPQTTQRLIQAYFEDPRGQIFYYDTPGLFQGKNREVMERLIKEALSGADLLVYVVDHTREWGAEEDIIFDIVTKIDLPIIMVVNKQDIAEPSFLRQYKEKTHITDPIIISAKDNKNTNNVIDRIFELLPVGERVNAVDEFPTPLLSHNSRDYLAEIVREKIYELARDEVPYQCTVEVIKVKSNSKDLIV